MPSADKRETKKPVQPQQQAADSRETPLPKEALPGNDEDEEPPLTRTWVFGLSVGSAAATIKTPLSTGYAGFTTSLQRQVSQRLGIRAGVGLNIATNLDPRPGADHDERGSMRGFEFYVGVPVYILSTSRHAVFVEPEFGITNHGYSYTDYNGSGALVQTAAFRYIQTRVSGALGYQYIPYDRLAGTVGFGVTLAVHSFSDVGDLPGQIAFQGSGSLLVRF